MIFFRLMPLVAICLSLVPAHAGEQRVTTADLSGAGSLPHAVAAAADGDTVTFAGATTVILDNWLTLTDKNLRFRANAAQPVTISGGGTNGILSLDGATSQVRLEHITLTSGSFAKGGAIYADLATPVTVYLGGGVSLSGNAATFDDSGGVFIQQGDLEMADGTTATNNPETEEKPFQNATDDTILQQIVAIFAEAVAKTENAASVAGGFFQSIAGTLTTSGGFFEWYGRDDHLGMLIMSRLQDNGIITLTQEEQDLIDTWFNRAEIASLFNQAAPEIHLATGEGVRLGAARPFTRQVMAAAGSAWPTAFPSDCRVDAPWRMDVLVQGGLGQMDGDSRRQGYDLRNHGTTMTLDRAVGELRLGTAFNYTSLDQKWDDYGGKTETKVYSGALYGGWLRDSFLLTGHAGGGFGDASTKRDLPALNYDFGHIASVGVYGGYSHGETEGRGMDSRVKSDSGHGGVIARLAPLRELPGLNIVVDAGFTFADNSSRRTVGRHTVKGGFDQDVYTLSAGVFHRFDIGNGFRLMPGASYRYTHLEQDGFDESGLTANRVHDYTADSHVTRLGLEVSRDFAFCGGVLAPAITASWLHEFGDREHTLRAEYLSPVPGTFPIYTLRSNSSGRDTAELGFALRARRDFFSGKSLGVNVGYTLGLSDRTTTHSVFAGVDIGF